MLSVEKYGGSSVSTLSKIKKIAKHIEKSVRQNNKLVVVLSAMGKTTNKLLSLAKKLSPTPQNREQDVLLCTGEMVSVSLLCIALNQLKIKAISLCGFQAGINTTSQFGKAFIKDVNIKKIEKLLKTYDVVVVAGFQGIDKQKNLTTLGRGGSDTTAVAIASKLRCPCKIFTDVESVFMANPKSIKNPKNLKSVDINSMLEIASCGAKVLDTRCLEIAKKYNTPLFLGKSLEKDETKGSNIFMNENFEEPKILAICDIENLCLFEIKKDTNSMFKILEALKKENQNLLGFSLSKNIISFLIAKNDATKLEKTLKNTLKNAKIKIFENFCLISLVGFGFSSHPQISQEIIKNLTAKNVKIKSLNLSETKISITLKQSQKKKALKILSTLLKVIK